ncbi:unnamed protein product [Prorocentrum cordatum]|uniref:Uncharacterized protein n=1 Tax=Prorocentrum cordatum TaxID=2364126 RepID=A0ABN9U9R5_9DINO|nr:unnamed protein product [Polarella glacialis]
MGGTNSKKGAGKTASEDHVKEHITGSRGVTPVGMHRNRSEHRGAGHRNESATLVHSVHGRRRRSTTDRPPRDGGAPADERSRGEGERGPAGATSHGAAHGGGGGPGGRNCHGDFHERSGHGHHRIRLEHVLLVHEHVIRHRGVSIGR